VSQQTPPNNQPFIPPPPPIFDSPYDQHVLEAKAAAVASEVKSALIMSIVGLFCFGFIFGFLAFRKANEAIETIDIYGVAREKRGLAMVAKVLAIIDVVGWVLVILLRVFLAFSR
jgi:hypothetical protein